MKSSIYFVDWITLYKYIFINNNNNSNNKNLGSYLFNKGSVISINYSVMTGSMKLSCLSRENMLSWY